MKKKLHIRITFKWLILLFAILEIPSVSTAQKLKISDFVLFGKNVQIGTSSSISGGSVGANVLVTSAGNLTIDGNIYSGGTVAILNNNVISGKIAAANTSNLPGTILAAGSGVSVGGNIDVNGNIVIGGGTIAGTVTHTEGTIYSGPVPKGGNISGIPDFPLLPETPAVTTFPNAGTLNINSTQTITPGAYGDITLGNNKILTLSGTGI
ncbi:MAG TPA: hypothetical protein VLI68_15315, partial [Hanamia sp.]|nr:hypothetical protein [Hanamia sp.]